MPYRCRDCGKRFSVRVGTVMQSSKLGYQTWLLATYLLTTSLKSVSSMKLHRDLDVTQKTAWHLAHRIRKGLNLTGMALFSGPVEVDEAYLGGKRKNMPKAKRAKLEGRGAVERRPWLPSKIAPPTKCRPESSLTPSLKPSPVSSWTRGRRCQDLHGRFNLLRPACPSRDGQAFSPGVRQRQLPHQRSRIVLVHVEAELPRNLSHFSEQHSDRYVGEFAARHNLRRMDTLDQMALVADRMVGKRLRYKDLVG